MRNTEAALIYRNKPDDLTDKRPILDAMGRCRKMLLAESDKVRPFGVTYKAIDVVLKAIDGLATFLTGRQGYYALGGSTPGSDDLKWRDSGTGQ